MWRRGIFRIGGFSCFFLENKLSYGERDFHGGSLPERKFLKEDFLG